jgi:prepilin-type N-terminal cleavage/methylation domain-containing protein
MSGFSIIELLVVLMVGSILTSIALMTFDGVSGRYAVTGAQRTFLSLHARARARNLSTIVRHSWGLIREQFPVW